MAKIGIIAGNGKLPFVIAKAAAAEGYQVYVCAVRGETDQSIESLAEAVEWVRLGQVKKLVGFFKGYDVKDVLMAGKITKTNLFKGQVWPDFDMMKIMAGIRNREDDTLLGAIADYLESKGLHLLSSVSFLNKSLPKQGILSKKKPSKQDEEEIEFGWKIAKAIAGLDIGQTVVTKNKAVLAVEAIEGTDEAILRGGELGSGDVTVVKVAKPNQDMRFDVPTVGMQTLEKMILVGAKMLAFEAEKTILIDRDEFIRKVNECGVIVVAK